MKIKTSASRKAFLTFNYIFLAVCSLMCLIPFVHLWAVSFSNPHQVAAGWVSLWPKGFHTTAYEFALHDGKFARAMFNSIIVATLGTGLNLVFIVLTAYPLSKTPDKLLGRNLYIVYFFITMLISGGMIPTYLVVAKAGLKNTLWSLILPTALPVYNMIIQMNFIRGLPGELEEAARIDGATEIQVVCKVLLPLLKPSLATVGLFSIVNHWNAWLPGSIYLSDPDMRPLSTYLRSMLANLAQMLFDERFQQTDFGLNINVETGRAAQLFLSALPVMLVYPFLQKYFTKGMTVGSVKG